MGNIKEVFLNKKANIGYLVAGYPSLEFTKEFLNLNDGLDIVEIGIPYSDPLADGKLISSASFKACQSGVNTQAVFDALRDVKTGKILVFLVYYNLILAYGEDKFLANSKEVGISAIIVPDMPFEESFEFRTKSKNKGIDLISLIAPTTNASRAENILRESSGFIYAIGSLGVTGGEQSAKTRLKDMINFIKAHTNLPVAVGFGIKTKEDIRATKLYADGAIVGTRIVELCSTCEPKELNQKLKELFS